MLTKPGAPHWLSLSLSLLALFTALGGTVYAAARINGAAIRVKSLPGNRLRPHSLPANRLRPGVLAAAALPTPLTGADINELTLGEVPSAVHAETADSAQSAVEAETAISAVDAIEARTLNGHAAGCRPGSAAFAGACWETTPAGPATAPQAAAACARAGGSLPDPLALAAFAAEPGVNLDAGGEWSNDLTNFSGPNAYAGVTVSATGVVDLAIAAAQRHFRCVIPLVA